MATRPRRPNPKTRRPAEVLTDAEMRALAAAFGDGPVGARHRAWVALMYRASLRVSEARSLRCDDVDLAADTLRPRHKLRRCHPSASPMWTMAPVWATPTSR